MHAGGGHLFCADNTAPRFLLVNPVEPTAQLIDGPFDILAHSSSPVGITTDGSHVYVGGTNGDDIDVYDLDGNYVRSFSVASQTGFPEGIAYNPITRHLYVVDGQGGHEVHESTRDGTFVQTFAIAPDSPDGLAFDHKRCSYWLYDAWPSSPPPIPLDMVRHYDLNFVEMESFVGPHDAAGFGCGEGVAVIGDRLYIASSVSGEARVVIIDIADAMVSDLCDVFADGFESGDVSAWSGVTP